MEMEPEFRRGRRSISFVDNDSALTEKIELYVKQQLGAIAHGFDHTKRVYNLCLRIGRIEKADLKVLLAAALLHDLGRGLEEHLGVSHAESAEYLAKDFLKSIKYPEEKIKLVFLAIRQHRTTDISVPPDTLEARILSDTDKLDSLGAIGVARVFAFGGRHGRDIYGTVNYFVERLRIVRNQLFTETAKRIADERIVYTNSFLRRMQEEDAGLR